MDKKRNRSRSHRKFKKNKQKGKFTPVTEFKFHGTFEETSTNGLIVSGIYLPEEVIENILSYIPPKKLLDLTLVCKKWCNIIKSESFWFHVYEKYFPMKPKKLPWYVFYCYFTTDNFHNLIKNGNGQEQFKHWKMVKNFGNQFKIENPPVGSEPLPLDEPEFYEHTSCFVTSYSECNKIQKILLENKRLLRYILYTFTPSIYVSEWVAGRFDCGCVYQLGIKGYKKDISLKDIVFGHSEFSTSKPLFYTKKKIQVIQWEGKEWQKVEILVNSYPPDIGALIFEHIGQDTQFWKGHYGSKMAGGVLKFVFDSIQPLENIDNMGVN